MAYNEVAKGIEEWSTWWYQHRDTARGIDNEIAFIKKAIDGVLDLIAVGAVEVEAVKRLGLTVAEKELERKLIALPTGIRIPTKS